MAGEMSERRSEFSSAADQSGSHLGYTRPKKTPFDVKKVADEMIDKCLNKSFSV